MNQKEAFRETLALCEGRWPIITKPETSIEQLQDMLRRIDANSDATAPNGFSEAKLGRWLGYLQGVAASLGALSLDECKELNKKWADDKPSPQPFDRADLYRRDAEARQRGENLDGSKRRECICPAPQPDASAFEPSEEAFNKAVDTHIDHHHLGPSRSIKEALRSAYAIDAAHIAAAALDTCPFDDLEAAYVKRAQTEGGER